MFSHIGRIIKLVFSQSLLSESQLKEALSYTILGSSISVFVSLVGYSEFIYEYMRSNWAFQGEFRYKMEEYTKAAHLVCILDLVFRILLRLNLYSDTFSIDTSENLYARWTVRSLVTLRLALLSYIHYVLFSHNWNTASFLISPQTSKLVSKLVVNFLVFSIIFNLVDSLKMRSIDNLLNITNLVSPSEFKAEILNSQVYRELCAITYNMPRIIRKNGLHKVDYLVTVAHIIDEIKSYLPHTIDWISLFLNLTLALYSNSAGGLYLSALQTFSNVVDDQMCNIERKAVL
ncbi:hypothetical protein BEWA_023270 [Theileria equi strain WA]|uniref:Uncharacterized protein n=1 Tax=Theileria equi strain WA TaxID=1537102 RepID=L0AW70_THEEQ|nr:hypothetical protein BEWA_023270 [Theileria equi strain WA]AFZ79478.1 hypothetical protein BEWA_023270 [Theileria equi strain WA]|eukprot:XP_004829144.1 hypothetical protein BEWA_023270 [Theileria equi strain WA]